jgi:hypothetical protein
MELEVIITKTSDFQVSFKLSKLVSAVGSVHEDSD